MTGPCDGYAGMGGRLRGHGRAAMGGYAGMGGAHWLTDNRGGQIGHCGRASKIGGHSRAVQTGGRPSRAPVETAIAAAETRVTHECDGHGLVDGLGLTL